MSDFIISIMAWLWLALVVAEFSFSSKKDYADAQIRAIRMVAWAVLSLAARLAQ